MTIETPIFIVGAGRSGSTLFHGVLSRHPEVAWLAGQICNRYPNRPELNHLFLKIIDLPIVGNILAGTVRPGECYSFWENYCRGFSEPCRDLEATDVTLISKAGVLNALSKIPTNKRQRLVAKITGWSRIKFLKEIFVDAKFIHIVRDGRAVANSIINVDFWQGWKGPSNWRWGELSDQFLEEWCLYDKSFLVLAAIQWKILIASVENAREHIDEKNFMEVKYEDLCTDPYLTFQRVQNFCGLSIFSSFDSYVKKYSWRASNDKWREQLTIHQQHQLEDVLQSYLVKYGYF